MTKPRIGVLGIQGAYARHAEMIVLAGGESEIVKYREQLDGLDGLIIPGGESTTMTKVLGFRITHDDILAFAQHKPVFGTCAGLILIGGGVTDPRVRQLGLIDVNISRNAYGSQKDSFVSDISLEFDRGVPFHAVFIRAPLVLSVGGNVTVLSVHENAPVLIGSGMHLGATFHPELTHDTRIHRYFIQTVKEVKDGKTTGSQ